VIVQPLGRLFFLCSSESKKDIWYVCDLEPNETHSSRCNCPAWVFNVNRPCKHLRRCCDYIRRLCEREAKKTKPKARIYRLKKSEERKFRKRQ